MIGNACNQLKRNADLPDVVFHSLRHSSTTYKLKLNHGDIKATQGDTGHAQPDMVTEAYAHRIAGEFRICTDFDSATGKTGASNPFDWIVEGECALIILSNSNQSVSKNSNLLANLVIYVRIHLVARKSCGFQMDKK